MSWWDGKVLGLKTAVADEKIRVAEKVMSTCIHGETDCLRCATEDFVSQSVNTVWQSLDDADIKRVIYSLPDRVVKAMRKFPGEAVLAGGYLRATVAGETIHDIDIFVPTKKIAEEFTLDTFAKKDESNKHFQAEADGMELQVIWRYPYKDAYEILEQFDYTIVKAAIWFDDGDTKKKIVPDFKSICHERFYRDIARRMLVYDCEREVERIESMPRLLKYIAYGYHIEPTSLADVVVKTCLSMDLSKGFEGMRKQLEDCYKPTGKGKDWEDMTKKFEKPKPKPARSHDYSYGS